MTITSWGFVGFLTIAILAFQISPRRWRARVVFPATSLTFIGLVMPSTEAVGALLGYVGLVWLATEVIFRWPKRTAQVMTVSAALIVFGWIKAYEFLAFLPLSGRVPATIGLSYILLRSLQVLIDLAETPSLRPGLPTLFSFLTSWPCLVSGPIQRYEDFHEQLDSMETFKLSEDVLIASMHRMAKGYFFVLVLADITKHLWTGLEGIALNHPSPIALAGAQGVFLAHLFFDFSGYTHIVIGAGYLFGLQLPENFDHPWQSKSFLEFWGRWHMTMSNWFKTYVFNPLLIVLIKRWPGQGMSYYHGVVAFFLTFFLVGLWHGPTWAYVIDGLLLAIGASANQIYRMALRRWLDKKRLDKLSANRTYVAICAALTFTYISFSLSMLWLTFDQARHVVWGYRLSGLVLAELSLLLMMMFAISIIQSLPRAMPWSEHRGWIPIQIGITCAVIDAYTFLFPAFGGAFFYEKF